MKKERRSSVALSKVSVLLKKDGNVELEYSSVPADKFREVMEKYVPDIRKKIDHIEASTPKTFKRYTLHPSGTSFGTKFEGLKVSRDLPKQINGLFHAGSVGIIMSGWLGAANYGVIVANETDKFLRQRSPSLVTA